MIAITIWQPWATLIALGLKDIENRPWMPPRKAWRKPLYIHAGKRLDEDGWQTAKELAGDRFPRGRDAFPLGAVVGRVTLMGGHGSQACVRTGTLAHIHPDGPYACSRWGMGGDGWTSHWELTDAVRLPEPVECRGFQKLWTLPPEVAEKVAAQLQPSQREEN